MRLVGDIVLAENPETGEIALKRVVRTFENESNELVHVFVNGEELVTTPEHPFYVPKLGWTSAIKLRAGDVLVLSNGEYVIVEKVQHEILESPIKVYNFEVEDFHTYFVGESSVLVHNQCTPIDADDLSISKNTSKHINNNHNPNKYAAQLKHKPQQDALKELKYKSFFNADWSKTQIDDAVNYGYNQAFNQGVTSGQYKFEYLGDTVTVALENGQVQTAYGNYHYTYQELLNLLK